jgi:hypothetical protein
MAGVSLPIKALVITLVAVLIAVAIYAALTFPRTVTDFQVSFIDREQREFELPWLHDKVQVAVSVTSGSSLWRASITSAIGEEVWSHGTPQGEQQTYTSEWIALPAGAYNITFSTIGLVSLEAEIRVTSKGGIW